MTKTTNAAEETEAQKLFNDVLPDLNKESANRLIQHIAAGTLTANIQIGVGLRLMKKIIEWQRERVA